MPALCVHTPKIITLQVSFAITLQVSFAKNKNKKQRKEPEHFFVMDGVWSGLYLGGDAQWVWGEGYTFAAWVWKDGNEQGDIVLFCLLAAEATNEGKTNSRSSAHLPKLCVPSKYVYAANDSDALRRCGASGYADRADRRWRRSTLACDYWARLAHERARHPADRAHISLDARGNITRVSQSQKLRAHRLG